MAGQGYTFAFVKATEGDDLKDPAFEDHWLAMKKAGITRGVYHFYVTEDDPVEQARFFIDAVKLESNDLTPVVDIELIGHHTQPGLVERFRKWLELIEEHYGVKPIIYTTAGFWNRHLSAEFGDYPLWVAEYDVAEPRLPKGWATWHLWQWQGDAVVDGVERNADITRLNRPQVQISQLLLAE